jgi:hypothetical protein
MKIENFWHFGVMCHVNNRDTHEERRRVPQGRVKFAAVGNIRNCIFFTVLVVPCKQDEKCPEYDRGCSKCPSIFRKYVKASVILFHL